MPIYTYINERGHKIDRFFKINDKQDSVEVDGEVYTYCVSAPNLVGRIGELRSETPVRERLKQIKKAYPDMRSSEV